MPIIHSSVEKKRDQRDADLRHGSLSIIQPLILRAMRLFITLLRRHFSNLNLGISMNLLSLPTHKVKQGLLETSLGQTQNNINILTLKYFLIFN